ncbi:MAG: alpha/beta hydrolase [Aeromicrobium sp.]
MHPELAYTRKGSGEPLVLIHGIGHRRQAWNPVFERLAESYDVIAVDLSGFGTSGPYPADKPYTMENACDHFAAQFAVWGIERPHVVGNSMGGAIALELAARDLVASVTALSPAGFFRGLDRIVALLSLLILKIGSYAPPAIARRVLASAAGRRLAGRTLYEHGERLSAEEFLEDSFSLRNGKGFFPALKQGPTYSFKGRVAVPTTIAWGTRDKVLLYGQSGLAQERLPEANHVALPNCGHVPMIDDPELVVRVIQQTVAAAQETKDTKAA